MPPRFALGATLSLLIPLSDYPASAGWVLRMRLVPAAAGGAAVTVVGAAEGADHRLTASASATANWTAGTYSWARWVERAGEVVDVAQGRTELLPDPRAVVAPLDLRTPAEVALENVRAALRGRATQDVLRYTINGRSLEHHAVDELLKLEVALATQVRRERRAAALAAGRPDPSRLQVSLGRA